MKENVQQGVTEDTSTTKTSGILLISYIFTLLGFSHYLP